MTVKPWKMFFAAAVAATAANGVLADAWDDAMRRARELCAKMTLEEKAGELTVYDYREFGAERWSAYTNLVREGKASEADVDKAVVRSLAMKYVTGLFDDPFRYCDESKAKGELYSERNRREVLELTRESIVLLKNEGGILPLSTNRVVGLTGTWFDDEDIMRGGMGKDIFSGGDEATVFADGLDASVETLRGAMAKRWGGRLDARQIDMSRIARGEATLPGEDVVVLALGEPTSYTGERRGRARITLPEAELENLRTLKRGGKKIVSVVFAGRPVILDEVAWLSDAVVMAWYPGAMGAEALAEILCGETNPSGKLAQHIPLDVGQIPLSYREKRTFISCAYADIPAKPLYPFGYGLSYTTFSYGKPVDLGNEGGTRRISCEVTNTGTRRVVFALPQDAFAIYDADLKRVVEPGEFTVFVGGDADTGNAVRLLHPGVLRGAIRMIKVCAAKR